MATLKSPTTSVTSLLSRSLRLSARKFQQPSDSQQLEVRTVPPILLGTPVDLLSSWRLRRVTWTGSSITPPSSSSVTLLNSLTSFTPKREILKLTWKILTCSGYCYYCFRRKNNHSSTPAGLSFPKPGVYSPDFDSVLRPWDSGRLPSRAWLLRAHFQVAQGRRFF